MKEYELTVLFHPDLEIDLEKPLERVRSLIKDNGGEIVKEDSWGKRKLAYRIAKEDFAVYVYFEVKLPPQSVRKIQSTLNITDEVLRYLLTTVDPRAVAAAKAAAERAEKEKTEEKDEEE